MNEVQTEKCSLREDMKTSAGFIVVLLEHYRSDRYPCSMDAA